MWAFNWSKPMTAELGRGIENGPILSECLVNPPAAASDLAFSNDAERKNIEYIICSCYKVGNGTHLGFTLHATPTNVSTRFLGPHYGEFDKKASECVPISGEVV